EQRCFQHPIKQSPKLQNPKPAPSKKSAANSGCKCICGWVWVWGLFQSAGSIQLAGGMLFTANAGANCTSHTQCDKPGIVGLSLATGATNLSGRHSL
ncbi:hypothetical protein, partial [Methylomonas albis]